MRVGSFFPALLEPRRRVDKALWAVIMTAYICGTSTRKVDDLVRALGCDTGVSKSTVSRICSEIDEQVEAFRTRSLDHIAFPYVFLDATYVKARVGHHIVSRAVVEATGVTADGNREVLGLEVGDLGRRGVLDCLPPLPPRPGALRSGPGHLRRPLRSQGRHPPGVPGGIVAEMQGASDAQPPRPRPQTPQGEGSPPPFAPSSPNPTQPRPETSCGKWWACSKSATRPPPSSCPKPRPMSPPTPHSPKPTGAESASTNPLERVHKEIKRRSNVVGIFPDDTSVLRLVGAVLIEVHDDWQTADRRYLSEGSMQLIGQQPKEVTTGDTPALPAA